MAQTIEDVNSRTLLQQFHELYKRQNETETDVENLDAKIDQETIDRQTADLNINAEIDTLREQIESLGVLFTYKGEVATIQDLPAENNKLGDVWYVDSEQAGYIWLEKNGVAQWEEFGPAIDLSEYAKQEDLEQLQDDVDAMNTQVETNASNIVSLTNTKQDKLTAGENITIDENNVISASGGSGGSSKLYMHCISNKSEEGHFAMKILSLDSTIFTRDTAKQWLYNNGFISNNIYYECSGSMRHGGSTPNGMYIIDGVYSSDGNSISGVCSTITRNSGTGDFSWVGASALNLVLGWSSSFTDTVIEL